MQIFARYWLLAVAMVVQIEARAGETPQYAREFKGAVALSPDRVLAWEFVADGSGRMPLWFFAGDVEARSVGTLEAEDIAGAGAAGVAVLVAGEKLHRVEPDAGAGAGPVAIELPGAWLAVAHGAAGFVAGGAEDAYAVSRDGRAWTPMKFGAPGQGMITRLAAGKTHYAALRQTSLERDGWGFNVSELCLSSDGRSWRRIAAIEGGPNDAPVETLAWHGDQVVAMGSGVFYVFGPEGKVERIEPTLPETVYNPVGGSAALFRRDAGWVMVLGGELLESPDLRTWRTRPKWAADDFKGAWIELGDGAPALVGSTKADWTRKGVFPLAAILEPVKPAAARPALAAATVPAPFVEARETSYDWAALMAEADKRARATPPRKVDASVAHLVGTEKTALSKGSPWTADDLIAALQKGAGLVELAQVIDLKNDGADLDLPGILRLFTSPEWRQAERAAGATAAYMAEAKTWGSNRSRSVFADELAKLVIERRRRDLPAAAKPVDSPELRARYAAGDPAAAYTLFLLHYDMGAETKAGLPPQEEVIERATAGGYAPAQWLLARRYQDYNDKAKDDAARRLALYRVSAETGDARAAYELAKCFGLPSSKLGAAGNYAEAEYWFIEAGARAWPGQMDSAVLRAWLELSNLYSGCIPTGPTAIQMLYFEEATIRWLRELQSRGGRLAEHARLAVAYGDKANRETFAYEKRIGAVPPEVARWGAVEVTRLEKAAAAGDAAAGLKLAEAYATGRGLRQDDVRAVAYYERAAAAGAGRTAYAALARMMENGHGVKPDATRYVAWWRGAAEAGDEDAWMRLGDVLHFGLPSTAALVVPKDYAMAREAYEKAVEAGKLEGLMNLAIMREYGRGGPADKAGALELVRRAAERGHAPAMSRLAQSFVAFDVPYSERDYASAALWYGKAVEAGDRAQTMNHAQALAMAGDKAGALRIYGQLARETPPRADALFALGTLLAQDDRRDEAAEAYRAAVKAAPVPASLGLATNVDIFDSPRRQAVAFLKDYDEEAGAKPGTIPYLRRLARGGDREARVRLALRLAPSDALAARIWVQPAAMDGFAPAVALYYDLELKNDRAAAAKWLAGLVEKGDGQALLISGLELAKTNPAGAIALMERAAGAGNAEATFRLGMMQFKGERFELNREAGLARITAAAEAGFALAQLTLGQSLVTGDVGVKAEPVRGLEFLKKAAEQELYAPVAAQAAFALGRILEQGVPPVAANRAEAVRHYRRALELGGENPQLRAHVHELERRLSMELKGGK